MGVLLFIVAVILAVVLFPVGFGYAMFKPKRMEYFYQMAYSIDQLGNVVMQHAFNKWLIKDNGYLFGNPDETVSSVLGKNKVNNTLTNPGKFLDWLLNTLDAGHSIDAIETDE